jgi:hypothetical protein
MIKIWIAERGPGRILDFGPIRESRSRAAEPSKLQLGHANQKVQGAQFSCSLFVFIWSRPRITIKSSSKLVTPNAKHPDSSNLLLSGGLLPFIGFVFGLVTLNPRREQPIGHRQYHGTDEDTD